MSTDGIWTVRRTGKANPPVTTRFTAPLDRIIHLVRTCAFDEAGAAAAAIRTEARAECDHEAVGRASSFLGEIASIQGNLDTAVREFGTAIEHLEHTDLAGSISRAYRGLAYVHLISRMPNLALAPGLEARRLSQLTEVSTTKARAEFESAICIGFCLVGLNRLEDAENERLGAERHVSTMRSLDSWLSGLYDLLVGRLALECGRSAGDGDAIQAGTRQLEDVASDFGATGLQFWQAHTLDVLARALESADLACAIRHMTAAAEVYQRIKAARLLEAATRWIGAARPVTGNRYTPAAKIPKAPELPMETTLVSNQLVAGPKTRFVFERAIRFAEMAHPVLILGESGTGKEGLARITHEESARKSGPFISLNCAAVPDHLVESVLFGHRKGSFTGAMDSQAGLLTVAHGGTLFMDEIGEFPLGLQAKLLRFLESKRFRRIGDTAEQCVDIRIVAATNRRLADEVRKGTFREDLYYRLNVLRLEALPLRLRMEEVPPLAQFVAAESGARLTIGAVTLLMIHDWPGNVRQLRNVISQAQSSVGAGATVITRAMVKEAMESELGSDFDEAVPPHLECAALGPPFIRQEAPVEAPPTPAAAVPARDFPFMMADGSLPPGMDLLDAEREFQKWQMKRALERCGGAKARTARELGLNLQTFVVRAKKHDLIP